MTARRGRGLRTAAAGALLAGACLSCLASATAQGEAAIDLFSLSPEQLFDAEVVLASRTSESVFGAAAAVFVISGADIARSGATSIPEALRLAPGVQVARAGPSAWAISVRGFNSPLTNKLLVLLDGREVYDPLYSGVYWGAQDTAIEDIDRIEVIRGPGASLWGANAVNGVINIVTKSAADTQGGLVSVATGNTERGLLTARYGGALGQSSHWRVYGRFTDRAAHETLTGADAEDEWRTWRGGFRIDGDASARDSFTLQGDVYRSETGGLRAVPQRTAPYSVVVEAETLAEGGNLLGRWTRELADDSRLTGQLVLDVTARDQLTLRDERVTLDADAQWELASLGAHKIITGARYRNTNAEFTPSPTTALLHPSRRDQLVSAFVQDQIALSPDRWRLTLGSKIEHNDYTGVEVQPNARLQWVDGELQTAWTSVARAVRTPTALEHEFTSILAVFPPIPPTIPVPIEIDLVANPEFDSEELIAYEAGYRRRLSDDVAVDLAVFFNDYDKIGTASRMPPLVVLNPPRLVQDVLLTNMTTAETYGFEGVVNWRAAENLQLSANYSFLDMDLEGPPQAEAFDAEAPEGRSPRHQASLRGQWDAGERLALDGVVLFVDELADYDVDSYVRVDARIGWRLTDEIELELVGQNLLDELHREFSAPGDVNATVIERSVFGRLTWRR